MVAATAHQTRADFEAGLIDKGYLAELYQKYLPTDGNANNIHPCLSDDRDNIIRTAYDLFKRSVKYKETESTPFPEGHCRAASFILRDRLGYGKIVDGGYYDSRSILDYDAPHTFISLGYGYQWDDLRPGKSMVQTIVDITADQFRGPAVYVGDLDYPWTTEPKIDLWEC